MVGGLGFVYGGAVGAAVVGWLQYWIRQTFGTSFGGGSSHLEIIVNGILLVGVILVFRDGLLAHVNVERLTALVRRRRRLRTGRVAEAGPDRPVPPSPERAPAVTGGGHRPGRDGDQPLATVSGLSRSFGQLPALSGIDLALRSGSITAMVGPNGAGKSTFINLLSGLSCPRRGRCGWPGGASTGWRRTRSPASASPAPSRPRGCSPA